MALDEIKKYILEVGLPKEAASTYEEIVERMLQDREADKALGRVPLPDSMILGVAFTRLERTLTSD